MWISILLLLLSLVRAGAARNPFGRVVGILCLALLLLLILMLLCRCGATRNPTPHLIQGVDSKQLG